nr:MAG TPA: hypothetical protein [Caudoviricetes sp.]
MVVLLSTSGNRGKEEDGGVKHKDCLRRVEAFV